MTKQSNTYPRAGWGAFFFIQNLECIFLLGGERWIKEYFLVHAAFVDIFGVSQNWAGHRNHLYAF